MKRFKKLTVYILVGVLLSSSVMLSYRKADEVKAAAGTLTLSAAALVAIGLLGAYGIVYKGAVDSLTGDYVWESGQTEDYGDYAERLAKAMEVLYKMQYMRYLMASGWSPDPDNDWDGDENKPPTWEKLVNYMNENRAKSIALAGTVLGAILSAVAYNFLSDTSQYEQGYGESSIDTLEYGFPYSVNIVRGLQTFGVTHYKWTGWFDTYANKIGVTFVDGNSVWLGVSNYGNICFDLRYGQITTWDGDSTVQFRFGSFNTSTNKTVNEPSKNGGNINAYDNFTIYVPWNMEIYFTDGVSILQAEEDMDRIKFSDLGMGTDFQVNPDAQIVDNIKPTVYLPSNNSVGDFLGGLSTNSGNSQQTQNVVDSFINSLQQPQYQPSPEPEPDPEPNPNPNPDPDIGGGVSPNPNPDPDVGGNPDTGGDSDGGMDMDSDFTSLLADLKGLFPFCIPFDLINCFKLFNAEPVTPRIEVPLHFGIIDEDYTFVIDLKDFNGVAQVCRTMFLIMFVVGLVLSTRSLIRG